MKTRVALGAFVLATGCADIGRQEPPLHRLDLRAALQTTGNVNPVGVAITPDGQRFVFEEASGLIRIDGDVAVSVVSMAAMPDPGPTAPLKLPVTDLVSISPGVFALTAIGDGYFLDITAMTLQQRFCYLPDEVPRSLTQRTDALAYDAAAGKLYAQPVTYDAADVYQYSQVAGYEVETGVDVEWYDAGNDVKATGMIVMPEVGLVLGQGSKLTRFERESGASILLEDLERFGVRSIDGIAIDAAANSLVIVDQVTDSVFDIDLAALSL